MQAGSVMGSQRFCLRWNNHQTNLLSVFDQLLHDEAFVDVTLAVEGQFLKAHKMVLSACSPYFQELFVGHPDKHPIVILKDVPYSDMKSLLDFMYRGEVSVDQDRLTAFLKVAESLRIKGLTEVNEERCDLPSIANSLLNQSFCPPPPPPPIPSLHRLPMSVSPPAGQLKPTGRQQAQTSQIPASQMLNSALTAPKRKRGRPRKLSGSSPNPPLSHSDIEQEENKHPPPPTTSIENHLGAQFSGSIQHHHNHQQHASSQPSPVTADIPATSFRSCITSSTTPAIPLPSGNTTSSLLTTTNPPPNEPSPKMVDDDEEDCDDIKMEDGEDDGGLEEDEPPDLPLQPIKTEDPRPGTSAQDTLASLNSTQSDGERFSSSGLSEIEMRMMRMVPGGDMLNFSSKGEVESDDNDSLVVDAENNNDGCLSGEKGLMGFREGGDCRQLPVRRRMRRRTASSTDPAEALTEMSVRGLNLFRYASVAEGIYKCMECAKADVLKTFKNKYSFQRHAFLYHEGHQRKVFPCPVCAKEFSRPDKMKNHMKMVHECFIPKECMFPAVGFYLPP